MTKIKLCGLSRPCDIEAANALMPEYIGFVFARNSLRRVSFAQAAVLKNMLHPHIKAVGVFVDEDIEAVRSLLADGVIDAAQLHGREDRPYISQLQKASRAPVIQAFRIGGVQDIIQAQESAADCVLVDSAHGGSGTPFDWSLLAQLKRPYFLAGGLTAETVRQAVERYHPYAVDVSSGIESSGCKDAAKMRAFVKAVRAADV